MEEKASSQQALPQFIPSNINKIHSKDEQQDSISFDLAQQKASQQHLEIEQDQQQQIFSKTATNQFLAVSSQVSGNVLENNNLESGSSSPIGVRSDAALRTTAQFTHMHMPNNVNVVNQFQQQMMQPQPILAESSGQGHLSSHLKSMSTSKTNYFSHMSDAALNDYNMQQQQIPTELSQGRSSEIRGAKKNKQKHQQPQSSQPDNNQVHGLANQGHAVRSAQLHTNNGKNREIKKLYSKATKNSDKSSKRRGTAKHQQQQQQLANALQQQDHMPNEMSGPHHHTSHSQGKGRQSNHKGYQNVDIFQNSVHQSSQPTDQQKPSNIHSTQNNLNSQGIPMPTGDQYQGFNFVTPLGQNPFQFTNQPMQNGFNAQHQQQMMGYQMQQQQQPPQVHFIAKQQKFYGISPERAPLIFKHSSQEKRPYTSSGQVINKRAQKGNAQSSAITALYSNNSKGQKSHGFNNSQQQQSLNKRNQSQPIDEKLAFVQNQNPAQQAYSMQAIPPKTMSQKNKAQQSNSATIYRKANNDLGSKMPEQLQMELHTVKQTANQFKELNIKLKTKVKILENEMSRKERALEEFMQQSQMIQNAQKNQHLGSGNLAPIVQTAQRYQAETYLIMSLKKQVKEQKLDISRKDEELIDAKKNIKNTKFLEMGQEIKLYKDELVRLRYLLEKAYTGDEDMGSNNEMTPNEQALQDNYTQRPFNIVNGDQQSPYNLHTQVSAGGTFKQQASNSQSNFFPDSMSLSSHMHQTQKAKSNMMVSENVNTISNDDQVSSHTNDNTPQLPPIQSQLTSKLDNSPSIQHGAISLSNVDTRDNELIQKLTAQIGDKDVLIRQLQQQVDDFSKQRLNRLQNVSAQENKSGSAGPSAKSKLIEIKKQLKEKEKEITKLKTEKQLAQTANEEEKDKKVKQLQSQVNIHVKKSQEMKSELKSKDEKNEQLAQELAQTFEQHTQISKREQNQAEKKMKSQFNEMTQKLDEQSKENERLSKELQDTLKLVEENKNKAELDKETAKEKQEDSKQAPIVEAKKPEEKSKVNLNPRAEGELGLISTVLGCRENRDRIEFANDLKEFVNRKIPLTEEKAETPKTGLATDYKLKLSQFLVPYVKDAPISDLACAMPKYEFISPSLALIIMKEIRLMVMEPDLIQIFDEKADEERLPFDALRDLCSRFNRTFTDEHCAFITASYLSEIDVGTIFINFKEFLIDIKDPKTIDVTSPQKYRSIGSEGSYRGEGSPLSDLLSRSLGKSAKGPKISTADDERMLDIAESIFIKMSGLMNQKGRSVRGIFSKLAVPELFPDRTVLEILSPQSFLEGMKEAGIEQLQEFEIACLMRVLAKPELDDAVILNEFVMIMENFGLADNLDDDEDDYIPDTEQSVFDQSVDLPQEEQNDATVLDKDNIEAEGDKKGHLIDAKIQKDKKQDDSKQDESNKDDLIKGEKENLKDKVAEEKKKRLARKHNLENIDAKGVKILRKIARFLLKQFLHPREFFGKGIEKQKISTKKREFHIDCMKIKDFYLRVKIASIRKRLVENESLNKEICLDQKNYKDLINVKLMIKLLEEIAEQEQKVLLEEEKEAYEKAQKEEAKKDTINGSDVDTPRSQEAKPEQEGTEEEKKGDDEKVQTEESKSKKKDINDSYGVDILKFKNAQIRGKSNNTQSPTNMERQFVQLVTIEEDKNDTQTSQYHESNMSQQNLRSSNTTGLEFDQSEHTESQRNFAFKQKLSLSMSSRQDSKSMSGSIDDAKANVDLPNTVHVSMNKGKEDGGRHSERLNSQQAEQLSKSLAEISVNRFSSKDGGKEGHRIAPFTPLTTQTNKTQENDLIKAPMAEEIPEDQHAKESDKQQ